MNECQAEATQVCDVPIIGESMCFCDEHAVGEGWYPLTPERAAQEERTERMLWAALQRIHTKPRKETAMEEDSNAIDVEFNKAREAVNAKLREAASALREAAKLAEANEKDKRFKGRIQDESDNEYGPGSYFDAKLIDPEDEEEAWEPENVYEAIEEVYDAFGDVGWSTSSWYC